MAPKFRVLWLLALLPFVAPSDPSKGSGDELVVRVAQGLLRGKREQRPYAPFTTVYAFEGVPYARPPIGRLRFQDPEEQQPWSGVRNATSFGSICLQQSLTSDNVSGSEDCLFLNIYTADRPESWKSIKRPVLVFIHGGAFLVSSGNTNFERPDPLLRRGIVFVTINYRLGVMGAMEGRNERRRAVAIRRLFNDTCSDLPEGAIVACLQRVDAEELVRRQFTPINDQSREFFTITFLPSVEKSGTSRAPFLPAAPEQLLREGRFARVPYMTGFTTAEGIVTLLLGNLLTNSSGWAVLDKNFEATFINSMPSGLRAPEAVRKMRSFYLGDRTLRDANENLDTLQRVVQFFTDIGIALGTVQSAEIMARQAAPVYVYQFSRDGPIAFAKDIFYNVSHLAGVAHGDDLVYVFDSMDPSTNAPRPVPAAEQPLRDRQADIFANMIKLGNPTPPGSGLLQWPFYTLQGHRYMDMDVQLQIRSPPMGERIVFWRKLASSTEALARHGDHQDRKF
ncbi:Acetylcholinesterase [Gryllus bimaculatus]|nr:Acetylcholinesterase [Gryllus bimaculatus]